MEKSVGYEVVDQRAPRTYQAMVSALIVVGWLTGQPSVLLALASMLYVSVAGGRPWNIGYRLYFGVIQPSFGSGPLEDERMPTFAQGMGATWLFATFVCIQAGAVATGWGLALFLAAAAGFAAASAICLGCLTYRLLARARRIKPLRVARIDPSDVALPEAMASAEACGPAIVGFSHPLCSECQIWDERLSKGSTPFVTVNVREKPELARRYGISLVPTIFEVAGDGTVLRQLAP